MEKLGTYYILCKILYISDPIILYINIKMKTINVGISGKGKSVKKVLVNRSRSGNQVPISSRIDQPRANVSPFRNSIGLRKNQ